jgi:hypothetical protein
MDLILLYAAAVASGAITVPVIRQLMRKSTWKARFTLFLSTAGAGLVGFAWLAYNGLAQAVPVTVLFFGFVVIGANYSWAVGDQMEKRAQSMLEARPEMNDQFQANPVLRWLMKRNK